MTSRIQLSILLLAVGSLGCTDSSGDPGAAASRARSSDGTARAASLVPGGSMTPPRASTPRAAPAAPRPVRSTLGAEVRVVGLMVHAPTRKEFNGQPQLAFMGSSARTRVALEVFLPTGGIIEVDREASSLETFRDDRGSDLLDGQGYGGPFEMMPDIHEDGRSVVVVVASETPVDAGAGRIDLEGALALQTASTRKVHVAQGVELAPDARFTAGPFEFEVKEVGPAEWGEGWTFTIETDDNLASIIGWTVTDVAGQEHPAESFMTMSFNGTTQQTLRTEEVSGPVTVAIEAWDDARLVEIPFATHAGLGLR